MRLAISGDYGRLLGSFERCLEFRESGVSPTDDREEATIYSTLSGLAL